MVKNDVAARIERLTGGDDWLAQFRQALEVRENRVQEMLRELTRGASSLKASADWHKRYGLHRTRGGWVFREWLPNAAEVWLKGDFSGWELSDKFRLSPVGNGDWELRMHGEAVKHGQQYRMFVRWNGGEGDRLPSAVTAVARNSRELYRADLTFNALVWEPARRYSWQNSQPKRAEMPMIYEAHIGMAQEKAEVGTFEEFRKNILPRISRAGYNTVQLMGLLQHPYYASFGYQVTNFFAVSDLLGTPDDFKRLVDDAHGMGLRVTADLVHSHAAVNTVEGLSMLDGTEYQFFHGGGRGAHEAWGTRCFDYGKPQVLRFLTSSCRFWLEEYRLDGFRFDGVTSMLYYNHGLGVGSWGSSEYFGGCDNDAYAYLAIANRLVKEINPEATSIAEDVSGMPGLAAPAENGGCGFDYRLAMGVTDYWFKLTDIPDEHWNMGGLWHELSSRSVHERCISYVESHDQALVGGQTFIFKLIGAGMYDSMEARRETLTVSRGMALHKMARLATFGTAGDGYLNFMGNEFGHPEWVDFPTERNGWSFQYARRQWSLADNEDLKYKYLGDFDREMIGLSAGFPGLYSRRPNLVRIDEEKKILVFNRGNLFFCFNFHPDSAAVDYGIICLRGRYRSVLDTDRPEFGGYGNIPAGLELEAEPEITGVDCYYRIKLYLPPRTGIVFEWIP